MVVKINNKEYKVKEAKTLEEKKKGLLEIKELPKDEGMLFYLDSDKESFWMKDTLIPLDIVFINDDMKVIKVYHAEPNDEMLVNCPNSEYVLEVNINSGIKKGDEVELTEGPVMKVLAPDGSTLMDLYGGERIFRRAFTKLIIRWAKKAEENQDDSEKQNKIYIRLGKKMFKEIDKQDNRKPEYVTNKNAEL